MSSIFFCLFPHEGINMVAVGITDVIDAEFLQQISGQERTHSGQVEGKDYFTSPDFLSLDSILRTLVDSACSTPDPSITLIICLMIFTCSDFCYIFRSSIKPFKIPVQDSRSAPFTVHHALVTVHLTVISIFFPPRFVL